MFDSLTDNEKETLQKLIKQKQETIYYPFLLGTSPSNGDYFDMFTHLKLKRDVVLSLIDLKLLRKTSTRSYRFTRNTYNVMSITLSESEKNTLRKLMEYKQEGALYPFLFVVNNRRNFVEPNSIEPEFNGNDVETLIDFELLERDDSKSCTITDKGYMALRNNFNEFNLEKNPTPHLLEKYNKLTKLKDPHRRGYLLQDLMNETFNFYGVRVSSSFIRNEGGEQIDGAFSLDGWFYIVECRWRKKLADIRELDGLYGQVNRSGKQTMGFFLSINGWSDNVPPMLKQNKDKCVILMNGDDLQHCLSGKIDFLNFLRQKVEKLNFIGEPFYGATEYLSDNMNP